MKGDGYGQQYMKNKDLTLRERRKIYEDAICIVKQAQKINDASVGTPKERSLQLFIEDQYAHCSSIIASLLGCDASASDNSGATQAVRLGCCSTLMLSRQQFDALVQRLPNDKTLKEALWKLCIKNDSKAIDQIKPFVA